MKKSIALILAILILSCLCACGGGDTTSTDAKAENNKLDGVGSVTESVADNTAAPTTAPAPTEPTYKPLPNADYLIYKRTDMDSDDTYVYEYNDKGHISKLTLYQANTGETFEYEYTYTYNDDGSFKVEYLDIVWDTVEEYDANGFLVKKDKSKHKYVTEYVNDENGNPVEVYLNGSLENSYEYDENGQVTKECYYDGTGPLAKWYEYTYNDFGYITEKKYYLDYGNDVFGDGEYLWEYEYDAQGRIVKAFSAFEEYNTKVNRYHYEYDEAGNLSKYTDFDEKMEYEYRPKTELIR